MIAIAVGGEAVSRHRVIHIARVAAVANGAGGFHSIVPGAKAAIVAAGFHGGRLGAGLAGDVDHPAGRVTVQGREGAAQHLNGVDAADIDIGRLPLAVGHGRRNAVHIDAQPAHAVGGAGAKAANRQLQILGIVLPVLHLQARHGAQRFRKVDARRGLAHLIPIDHADGGGGIQFRNGGWRSGHHHSLFIGGLGGGDERQQQGRQGRMSHG